MLRTGIDMVAVSSLTAHLAADAAFINHVWTQDEQVDCADQPERLATRWAAKEATMKALGTGWPDLEWTDISVASEMTGPRLSLRGEAAVLAETLGLDQWQVSLSHEPIVHDTLAIAIVVATGSGPRTSSTLEGVR